MLASSGVDNTAWRLPRFSLVARCAKCFTMFGSDHMSTHVDASGPVSHAYMLPAVMILAILQAK